MRIFEAFSNFQKMTMNEKKMVKMEKIKHIGKNGKKLKNQEIRKQDF